MEAFSKHAKGDTCSVSIESLNAKKKKKKYVVWNSKYPKIILWKTTLAYICANCVLIEISEFIL